MKTSIEELKREITPLPWHMWRLSLIDEDESTICSTQMSHFASTQDKAHLVFIAHCVNNFEAMRNAMADVSAAHHNFKTAMERFGYAGKFKEILQDKIEAMRKVSNQAGEVGV